MIRAFGDESYVERDGNGIYVLGLIWIQREECEAARDYARGISQSSTARFHFHDVNARGRIALIDHIAKGPWGFRVWANSSSPKMQERTRRKLLTRALQEHSRELWTLESRGRRADLRDRELAEAILGFRSIEGIRLNHLRASDEPLLWPADVVASATARALSCDQPLPFGGSPWE